MMEVLTIKVSATVLVDIMNTNMTIMTMIMTMNK